MQREELIKYFDNIAHQRDYWYKKNEFYHSQVHKLFSKFIPPGKSIMEIGCATGNLLAGLSPSRGLGIDFSSKMIDIARKKYPDLEFMVKDVLKLDISEKFDFIILSDVTGVLLDIWQAFREIRKLARPGTLVIINSYNFLWCGLLRIAEKLRLKMDSQQNNWLSIDDLKNLLYLANFEVMESGCFLPLPIKILPFFERINGFLSHLPFFRHLGVSLYLAAKPIFQPEVKDISCSVIIACRNEAGNIEGCVTRTPQLAGFTEIIFIDGSSSDGTVEEIKRMQEVFRGKKNIELIHQQAGPDDRNPDKMLKAGKGDALRKGFDAAKGEILLVMDADLTVDPEELSKFYLALAEGKADFINGVRLVYPLEDESMRFLNYLGNKFFGLVFSWLINQPVKDTLCANKALLKKNYLRIKENRGYFGDFDPFGDFDLLFGAAKLNFKIVDMPVHYRPRAYGKIKIERFKHGLLLLKMSLIGFRKLKLKV